MLEVLQSRKEFNAQYKKLIDSLAETSKTTFKLLENLLTWARLQRGDITFKPKKYAIAGFIENTLIDILRMYKKDKNVTYLPGYEKVVNGIAILADIAEQADPSVSDRIQAALEKFYELG
jgi:K+-sensing histidine kinase KdpD